jgi:hypothetical protein
MAVLSDTDRAKIWRGLMRYSPFGSVPNVVKTDLRAAVNAADDWVDTNSASFNTALPTAFRNNANATQKSLLLVAVVLMRQGVDLLRSIFGGVD